MIGDLLTAGWRFHQAGDLLGAEQAYRLLIQLEPDNAQGWVRAGDALAIPR